jgi:hypothetical protein
MGHKGLGMNIATNYFAKQIICTGTINSAYWKLKGDVSEYNQG